MPACRGFQRADVSDPTGERTGKDRGVDGGVVGEHDEAVRRAESLELTLGVRQSAGNRGIPPQQRRLLNQGLRELPFPDDDEPAARVIGLEEDVSFEPLRDRDAVRQQLSG